MKKTRLLSEVHETARSFARIGAIDKHTFRDLDALCLAPVRELSAKQIRAIRSRTQMSQAVFAAVRNTIVSTAQKWEIGDWRETPERSIAEARECHRTQRRQGACLSLFSARSEGLVLTPKRSVANGHSSAIDRSHGIGTQPAIAPAAAPYAYLAAIPRRRRSESQR